MARTWTSPIRNCRWRFWKAHTPSEKLASEVAEHLCNDERLWIARGTDAGTSWMIDDELASLFHILDRLPAIHYPWVLEQTLAALGEAAPRDDDVNTPNIDELPEEITILSEFHQLTLEVMRLAHAGDTLQALLPANASTAAEQALHKQLWARLAA